MSRTGECYDNAVMERFFWSLKHEWTKHESFADLEAARLSVFKYVETFDNPVRLHQSLGYKSPNQFEALRVASHRDPRDAADSIGDDPVAASASANNPPSPAAPT